MAPRRIVGLTCLALTVYLYVQENGWPVIEPPAPPGPRTVLLLEQDAKRNQHPWLVKMILDPALRKSLEDAGHTYRLIDADHQPPVFQPYFDGAESLPWLVIESADRGLYAGPPPQTVAELLALVREHGG